MNKPQKIVITYMEGAKELRKIQKSHLNGISKDVVAHNVLYVLLGNKYSRLHLGRNRTVKRYKNLLIKAQEYYKESAKQVLKGTFGTGIGTDIDNEDAFTVIYKR